MSSRAPATLALLLLCCCTSKMLRVVEERPLGPDTFRVAIMHLSSVNGRRPTQEAADRNLDANLARTFPLIRMAARAGAKVIITPEYCNTGIRIAGRSRKFLSTRLPPAPTPGPLWETGCEGMADHLVRYARLSREVDAYVVTDVLERSDEGGKTKYYNSMVAFDPQGRLVANYRKINLYMFENFLESRGKEPGYFDTPWGRFGMLLCFDTMTPKTWKALVRDHEVDFFCAQTLWEHTPLTGRWAMNLLANFSGRTVCWSNQQRGWLGGGAGVIRPGNGNDASLGLWAEAGIVVANLPVARPPKGALPLPQPAVPE